MATIVEFPANDAKPALSRVRRVLSAFANKFLKREGWFRSATATSDHVRTTGGTSRQTRLNPTEAPGLKGTNIIPLREIMDRQQRESQELGRAPKIRETPTERLESNYELNNIRGEGKSLRVLATDPDVIARGRKNRERASDMTQEPLTRTRARAQGRAEQVEPATASSRRTDNVSQVASKILDITNTGQTASRTAELDQWTRDNIALARLASSLDQSPPTKRQLEDLTHSNTALRSAIGVVAPGQTLTSRQRSKVADAILKEVRAQGLASEAAINPSSTRESQKSTRDAARISDRAFNAVAKDIGARPIATQQLGKGANGIGVDL